MIKKKAASRIRLRIEHKKCKYCHQQKQKGNSFYHLFTVIFRQLYNVA